MLTSDIRRRNARSLSEVAGSSAEFARRIEMSDSHVSQLIGENPTKNIGNKIARRMEAAFDKQEGWMDVVQESSIANNLDGDAPSPDKVQKVTGGIEQPLFSIQPIPESYIEADDFVKLADLFSKSTRDGRRHILRAAMRAEKITISQGGSAATKDQSQ